MYELQILVITCSITSNWFLNYKLFKRKKNYKNDTFKLNKREH